MFSCIKFIENGKKQIMTAPSNWIVGDSLCWPTNYMMVNKLFKECADPHESWKQIKISKRLFAGKLLCNFKNF